MSSSHRSLPWLSLCLPILLAGGCTGAMTPAGGDDAGATAPADAGAKDAGDDDAGMGDDDAGPDAGQNHAPVITSFTSSAHVVDDPGTVTLRVVATDMDGDALHYSYSVVGDADGISFEPAGPTSEATTTVTFGGDVPRGVYVFQVEVSDGEESATATLIVSVNNHPPMVSAGAGVVLLPESPAAERTLTPVIEDVDLGAAPADTLTIHWGIPDELPAGIAFDATDPLAPTVRVDRAVYEQDPSQLGFHFTVTLSVHDDTGASASDSLRVTVLDERGAHVDNTSPYAGAGPAGYCGSRAHPCNNVMDAQANLASLRAIDENVPNELLVATTDTPYALDETVVLEAGTALRCGFDADELDSEGGWAQTAERTPLRSTSDVGLLVHDPLESALVSVVERCGVEMIAPSDDVPLRLGILVDAAGATLVDNLVKGSTTASANGVAVGVRGPGGAPVELIANELDGGAATESAIGILVQGGSAALEGNVVRSGQANVGAALAVEDGALVSSLGDTLMGGGSSVAMGLDLDGASTVTLTGATVRAPGDGTPATSIGARTAAGSSLTLVDSTVQGGDATVSSHGVFTASDNGSVTLSGTNVSSGTSRTNISWAVVSQSGSLLIEGSAAVPAPLIAAGDALGWGSAGVYVACPAPGDRVRIDDAVVSAGEGGFSVGLIVDRCANGSLTNNTVTAAGAHGLPNDIGVGGRSEGLDMRESQVAVTGGTYTGGSSVLNSAGVVLWSSPATLSGVTALGGPVDTAGLSGAAANSAGLVSVSSAPGTRLSEVVATGGAAPFARSFGAYVVGNPVTDLVIDDATLTGGSAGLLSVGAWIEPTSFDLAISGSTLVGRLGGTSGGLVLRGDAFDAVLDDNVLRGGNAGEVAVLDHAPVSVGVWLNTCAGCLVQRNVVEGGSVSGITGRSIGVRVNSRALSAASYLVSNVIAAGDAPFARGLELSGYAAGRLRVLHNNVYGGGNASGESAAVYLGQEPPEAADLLLVEQQVASFGGNIIDAGIGAVRVGFWESCADFGAFAIPSRPATARNSNFWPSASVDGDVIYVRSASVSGVPPAAGCQQTDLSIVDDVNGADVYAGTSSDTCTSLSFDQDPDFTDGIEIDGVIRRGTHLANDSPLRGAAPGTYANDGCAALGSLWDQPEEMLDIDGEPRPSLAALDIGADEVP